MASGIRSNKGEINTDGYNYQLYTLLHFVDCLRSNEKVREYDIGNAVVGFGALDDVVFTATLASGTRITNAIQVKHSNAKTMIDERYLCQHSRTYLYKYFESFEEIKKRIPLQQLGQLGLWTNMPITDNIRHWFESYVAEAEQRDLMGDGSTSEGFIYERYRIKAEVREEVIQKCLDQVRKEKEKGGSSRASNQQEFDKPLAEEWDQFFRRFVFHVNVPKVLDLKTHLVRNVEHFDDLCKLVESCAVRQIVTSSQIDSLYSLISLRSSMELGPYAKLVFEDLNQMQCHVREWFENGESKVLRVKASQNVDCTVARLIPVMERCLAPESKRYLVFRHETFVVKWNDLQPIVDNPKTVEIGLKCIIISYITDDEIREVESRLSNLKVIFVGSTLKNYFDDKFNINSIDDANKEIIKQKNIKLSQWQSSTVSEIFGEKLFQKENYSLVLELYRLYKDSILKVTVNEPSLDVHYRSRTAKLISRDNSKTSIDLLNQNEFQKLVICDSPGMGKTTEMIKLCSSFRAKFQDHLVVFLHFREAISKWRGSVIHLISNTVTSCSKLTGRLVKRLIRIGKVILIMDGYDEVSQECNKKLKLLVKRITRIRMFKLYITARPQHKDEIDQIVRNCGLCHLDPFSEDDQLAYLNKFWKSEKSNDEETQQLIDRNVRCIIQRFRSMVSEYGGSLIEIPLQTHMVAVIYKDRILSPDFEVSKSHALGYMYEEFVELKFMESVKRNYDQTNVAHAQVIKCLRESFLHDHIVAAVKIHGNKSQSEMEQLCDRMQHYGLITTRPAVSFIHYTYLEYFLALYILTYSIHVSRMENFILNLLFKSHRLVGYFMNYILDQLDPAVAPNRSLYESVYSSELFADSVLPASGRRLHHDKMTEFSVALYKWDVKTISEFLAFFMRQGVPNTFELFYDSLHEAIKSQMQLCFNFRCCEAHETPPKMCCSVLSESGKEDQLIPILNVLVKTNPENTFDTLFLTVLGDREMSLLELMCNRRYSKLFAWFSEIRAMLNEAQIAAIESLVVKRLNSCLRQIIESNNSELLKTVVDRIDGTWTVQATIKLLTEQNLLRIFTESIEIGTMELDPNKPSLAFELVQTVEETEATRVKMVNNVFDLYRKVFEYQKLPLSKEIINAVRTIRSKSIRRAFETNILSILEHFMKNTPDALLGLFSSSLTAQKTFLLELMCYPKYSKLFEWFTEIVCELEHERHYAIRTFVERRLSSCLLQIIEFDNVELLQKVIIWVKNKWTVETTRKFLLERHLLCFFAKNIEHCIQTSDKSKRIEMVHSVFDLCRLVFNEQIPLGRSVFNAIRTIKSSSIKSTFVENVLSIFESAMNKSPNAFITSFLASLSAQKTLLELFFDPCYSRLFEGFADTVLELNRERRLAVKKFVERRLRICLLKIVEFNNVELLQQIILGIKHNCTEEKARKFLADKYLLRFFTENIEHRLRQCDNSKRIEMVHSVFELYRWAFDEPMLLDRCFFNAIRRIKSGSIRRAFVTNVLSIFENVMKNTPDTFELLFSASLNAQKTFLLELICDPNYLKLFEWFVDVFSKLNQERRTSIRNFVERRLGICFLKMIEFDNVELLQKAIFWVENKWTVGTTTHFLIDKQVLFFFTQNIEHCVQKCDKSKRIEMVHCVFDLYRWAFYEQIPLGRKMFEAIRSIKSSSIRRSFVENVLSIFENVMKNSPDTFAALFLTSIHAQNTLLELMCDPNYSNLCEWFIEILPELNQQRCIAIKIFFEKRLNICLLKIIELDNVELLQKVAIWVKSTWTKQTACQFLMDKHLLRLFTKNIENCLQESNELKRIEMVHCVFELYCWAFDEQMPLGKTFSNAIRSFKSNAIKIAFVENMLSIFENLMAETPDIFYALFLAPRNARTTLLELICDPNYLKLFEWLLKFASELNQQRRTVILKFVENRLNICLLKIIEFDNVELLQKAIIWVKSTWEKKPISQFLIDKHLLPVFTKNIEHSIRQSDKSKRIEMVHSVFDLHRWAFDGQVPMGKYLFNTIRTVKSSSIRRTFISNVLSIFENVMKNTPDIFVTSFLESFHTRKTVLNLMCDPDYLKLFGWFTEIGSELSQERRTAICKVVERRLGVFFLKIIEFDNVELIQKVIIWARNTWTVETISQFLTNKHLLRFFIKNIEFGIQKSNDSKRIEMVYRVFDLYHWIFGEQIPLESSDFDAIQTIKATAIRQAFAATFGRFNIRRSSMQM